MLAAAAGRDGMMAYSEGWLVAVHGCLCTAARRDGCRGKSELGAVTPSWSNAVVAQQYIRYDLGTLTGGCAAVRVRAGCAGTGRQEAAGRSALDARRRRQRSATGDDSVHVPEFGCLAVV